MYQVAPIDPVPPMVRDMDLSKNRQESTTMLVGQDIQLNYDDGAALILRFGTDTVASEIRGAAEMPSGDCPYDAVEARPGTFFVHVVDIDRKLGLTHVIDREQGRAITVWDQWVDGEPAIRRMLRPARIAGSSIDYVPIMESRELIGRRAYCQYSEEAALEHVYVNSRAILWQWLMLPNDPRFEVLRTEVGIEAVSMRKVGDELFLLALHDGGSIELTLLMDFARGRNVGQLFGVTERGIVSRPVGAKVVPLGRIDYPQGFEPG
ncbi:MULTISPECIES: molybdenum cofactor biosynthesis F family protein [unclassified Sphingobium]|uniref:molybdenum cofactor biosynthesis F family protein n=1 Tax=unclassified Sphingobium TaxID=2611147 RepID=UPI0022251996|nr:MULTISPECIES: molybdenum cofactor biosynthesis F family protein [unclassified Sphingobium]MCW2413064.1 hypothetical protein [Sphingobium sp. B8D3D]MCW2414638.1 hypothetical protein [Sphingobium sp. B8D3A]